MVFTGQGAKRISTDGIDYLLGSLRNPEKSTATFFRQDGHVFYVLTFYGEEDPFLVDSERIDQERQNFTIMYDFTTDKFFNLSGQHLKLSNLTRQGRLLDKKKTILFHCEMALISPGCRT